MSQLAGIDAVLFDMDGVLTRTAVIHQEAWRATFDQVLPALDPEVAPYLDTEYFTLVDGRPRLDGLTAVLAARGLEQLPAGSPEDDEHALTMHGICRRKDALFRAALETYGVEVYDATVQFLELARASGRRTALVTSSRNSTLVLQAAGLLDAFDAIVDGETLTHEGLSGKPSPDCFVRAAEMLGVPAARCAVIEDAVGGVAAGAAGGFGLVVGIDIGAGREALLEAGADVVVESLAELSMEMTVEDQLDPLMWPVDPWRVEVLDRSADPRVLGSVLAVGNGYLGWRGDPDEHGSARVHGSYVNGFHETWNLEHAEDAVGFARVGQTLVAIPEISDMDIVVDDERFEESSSDIVSIARSVDLATATMTREVEWRTRRGKMIRLRFTRTVSWSRRHLGLRSVELLACSDPVEVAIAARMSNRDGAVQTTESTTVEPSLDPRRARTSNGQVLVPLAHELSDTRGVLSFRTQASGMVVAAGVDHHVWGADLTSESRVSEQHMETSWRGRVESSVSLQTFFAVHTGSAASGHDVSARARHTLEEAASLGMAGCLAEHQRAVDDFWARSDVRISHDQRLQQAIRWSLFQVACASLRADGLGVSAKGVSGSGYDGHYFWDTEIYVAPMLTYTQPQAARNLLQFRYAQLPAARVRAAEVSQAGALFPWRTINGQEASAYYAAGTAQYHIDADVAYAVDQYVRASGDADFMEERGVDILVETARMWADLGFWRHGEHGTFHIYGVTGPDEYTTVVNDNLYTNAMARQNLLSAARVLGEIEARDRGRYAAVLARLGIEPTEIAEWVRAGTRMHIGFDGHLGIHPQDAGFLDREVWDVPNTPASKRPLLLHYHPLVIYRFQVIKQADVVLALALLPEEFSEAQTRADFEYYDAITTGDSTLSGVAQAIVAARVGYSDLALAHFTASAFIDLTNSHHNTDAGVHVAAAGGIWSALVLGFAGMSDRGEVLRFDPRLPGTWPSLEFELSWRGSRLEVKVEQASMSLRVVEGPAIDVDIRGQRVRVTENDECEVTLVGQGPIRRGAPVSPALSGAVRPDGTQLIPALPV